MNKSIDALKLALEALELCMSRPNYGAPWTEKAITAIRETLAEQLAQEEPVSDTELINRGCHYQTELTKPAQQQDIPDLIAGALGVSRGTAYDLMREALAEQPAQQQEPVAGFELLREARDNCKASIVEEGISASRKEYRIDLEARLTAAMNTSPPASKPWVGLTDEEIIEVIHPLVMADMADEATDYEIARAIEAKLRERNEHREKNA